MTNTLCKRGLAGVALFQREHAFDTVVLLLQNKNKTKVTRSSVAASNSKGVSRRFKGSPQLKNGAERHFHASLKVQNRKPFLFF